MKIIKTFKRIISKKIFEEAVSTNTNGEKRCQILRTLVAGRYMR